MKPTSRLLAELLERTVASVLVLRNYHGYPEQITGDVDFLVQEPSSALWRHVEEAASACGWSVAQILDRPWIRKYTLCSVGADRPFFVLDFFRSLSWYTFSFLDEEAVFDRARAYHGFRVPAPEDEALITVVHYALYNGDVPGKYRARGQQSFGRYAEASERSLSEAFGSALGRAFVAAVRDGAWDEVQRLAPRLRLALLRRRATPRAVADLARSLPAIALARRAVPGALLAVEGFPPDPAVSELACRLKSSHVFSRVRELRSAKSAPGAVLCRARVALALRRGECVVLWGSDGSELQRAAGRAPSCASIAPAGAASRFRLHARSLAWALDAADPARFAEALLHRSAADLTSVTDTVRRNKGRAAIGSWRRRSLRIALLGPDGAGKSTVARSLRAFLAPQGREIEIRHWRPKVMLAGRRAEPVLEPHGKPVRSWTASLLKLAWLYTLFLGDAIWFRTRHRWSGRIEVFDRYFPDLLVDPRRYRYGGPLRLAHTAWRALPKPDLVLLLDAPADAVRQRVREVSREETERQITAYRSLLASLPNGHCIDAARPLGAVVEQAAQLVVLALRKRAGSSTGTMEADSPAEREPHHAKAEFRAP